MIPPTTPAIPNRAPAPQAAVLNTASGSHPLQIRTAQSFLSRFRGLMCTPPLVEGYGLLLTGCSSVHCAFMRYPIDVIYLGASGEVIKCVKRLQPWRISACNKLPWGGAKHTLELAVGSIERLAISPGDRLDHPRWPAPRDPNGLRLRASERGSSMTEFTVVGPVITVLGLAMLQYGMLFFAKNQVNHASFMAARAGSVGNASLAKVQNAYAAALVPMYGGGTSPQELAASLAKANADMAGNVQIELLNPTKESFDDWNEPALQKALQTGSKQVIPNTEQEFKGQEVGPRSGQTIQDANLIKLRVTHGYMPKVPVVASIYRAYLKWLDPETDAFHTKLVSAGRIPVVTHVTLQMQSAAIEDDPVSIAGPGNGGNPTDPGDPPLSDKEPPDCATFSCSSQRDPEPNSPIDPGGSCTGDDCPPCADA